MTRANRTPAPAPGWGNEPLRIDPSAVLRRIGVTRPHPPDEVGDDVPERSAPAPEFSDWIRDTFISASGALANPRYEHLLDANIGVLWTNVINQTKMMQVWATAEIPQTMGSAWKRARAEQQLADWFGFVPDFVHTYYAPDVRLLDDRGFCALVEHELHHCAQAVDRFGDPKFNRDTGRPIYAIHGHDAEEFVGVVERYGMTHPGVRKLVAAANRPPLFGDHTIEMACGTCHAKVAA